jgi:hypothetical protein
MQIRNRPQTTFKPCFLLGVTLFAEPLAFWYTFEWWVQAFNMVRDLALGVNQHWDSAGLCSLSKWTVPPTYLFTFNRIINLDQVASHTKFR